MDRYLGQDEDIQFWKIHTLYTDKQCIPTYSSMPWCSNRSPTMNYFVKSSSNFIWKLRIYQSIFQQQEETFFRVSGEAYGHFTQKMKHKK